MLTVPLVSGWGQRLHISSFPRVKTNGWRSLASMIGLENGELRRVGEWRVETCGKMLLYFETLTLKIIFCFISISTRLSAAKSLAAPPVRSATFWDRSTATCLVLYSLLGTHRKVLQAMHYERLSPRSHVSCSKAVFFHSHKSTLP
jgi:hypothetical protein